MTRLPDEILKEILVPPLRIPDVEFSSTGRASESPFGRTVRNSSSLLLVSKQWMRVATPLLYEVVIMRSTAQAQALAYAIKSNKAFGMFIKKLRMEGGFGKSPAHFIALAPNIRELFVTLDLWSSDSPSGLCSMLSGMNLCRVVINHQDGDIKNAKATQLWKSLCTCIPHWSNLEILEYHSTYAISINGKGKYWELAALLKASPSVKHVVFTYVPQLVLAKMALFTSLETVSVELMSSQQRGFISNNHTLRKLVKVRPERNTEHKTTPKVSSIASVVAGFKPLEKVPKHTAKPIWDLIFSFATHSYYAETPPSGKPLTAPNSSPSRSLCYLTARTLCLVSKSFREIARRHLFSIVQVESRRRFSAFTDTINDNDALARLVRVLRVKFLRSHETDCDNRMTQLLPKLTSLVCLDVPLIDLRQLKLLKPPASTNLQTLDVRLAACSESGRDTVNLGVLGGLTYFRCTFDSWESLRRPKLPLTLSVHLPNLTSFSIGMHDSEDTLDAFWTVRMPSLTHLQLCGRHPKTEEFLRLNGETVKVLDMYETPSSALWTWCPHLEHLTVRIDPSNVFKSLPEGQTHSTLSKLYFSIFLPDSTIEKIMLSATDGFEFVDFSQFPNFREVHIHGLTWPNTEREIKKNPRCTIFGSCMKKWGIVVYDESGTPWRERAQIRRGR